MVMFTKVIGSRIKNMVMGFKKFKVQMDTLLKENGRMIY